MLNVLTYLNVESHFPVVKYCLSTTAINSDDPRIGFNIVKLPLQVQISTTLK